MPIICYKYQLFKKQQFEWRNFERQSLSFFFAHLILSILLNSLSIINI